MAEKYNEVANRLISTRSAAGDPSIDHIVTGANAVYDDTVPYRYNGHIDCKEVIPVGTENPQELEWYEKVYNTLEPTLFEWIKTTDTSVDSEKTYGISIGAKQSDVNKQLYDRLDDFHEITINADDVSKVITSDANKIINKEDGYVPTAAAVGEALGANFEDSLQSTSIVKGLTANMGRALNEMKANTNGYYETMGVGFAKNLEGEIINSEAYHIRKTGGESNEVANGAASVIGMEGHTEKFNQLVRTLNPRPEVNGITRTINGNALHYSGTSTVTTNYTGISNFNEIIEGHVYYAAAKGLPLDCSLSIVAQSNIDSTIANSYTITSLPTFGIKIPAGVTVDNDVYFNIIDLTAIFGSGNEPSTVEEFEAWLAKNVGLKPYYGYNAGSLLSAQTLGVKTYGQNLLNPTTRQARLIPYDWEDNSNVYTIKNVPSGATATFTPDATGVAETVDISCGSLDITSYGRGILELSAATSETYVCMKWDEGKDDDVVPYEDHTYDFDVRKVYGKVSGAGEYVQCFPNGMRSAGDIKDTLTASEAVVNILEFTFNNPFSVLATYATYQKVPQMRLRNTNVVLQVPFSKIDSGVASNVMSWSENDTFLNVNYNNVGADAASYMLNTKMYYYTATPITYTDLVYRDGGIDTPITDVLFNIDVDNWSIEEQLLTPYDEDGNPTAVPATIKTKYSIDAVEAIKTLEKTSYFESDIHDNLQAMLTCINTNCASVLGGQFSISDTATDKLFSFTFTANTPTNSTEENTETI